MKGRKLTATYQVRKYQKERLLPSLAFVRMLMAYAHYLHHRMPWVSC